MKIIISFIFFSVVLFASVGPIKSDFKACFNRYKISLVKFRGSYAVAVNNDKLLFFSKKYQKGYIKRDPFLGLYLFHLKKGVHPVKFYPFDRAKKEVGVIGKERFAKAKIVKLSNGLDSFAKMDKNIKPNRLITCVCCRAFGLSIGRKNFIDSDFILRFLDKKRVVYADMGVKFAQKGSNIFVKEINPFFKNLWLRAGDKIVLVDGKKYKNISILNKYILFSKPGKIIKIAFKRGKHIYKQNIKLKKRLSGGLLKQTYLRYIGLILGYDLKIHYIIKNSLALKLGLKKGDKLLKINDKFIYSYNDIQKVLSKIKKREIYLLFSRDDFQFFVHFRR